MVTFDLAKAMVKEYGPARSLSIAASLIGGFLLKATIFQLERLDMMRELLTQSRNRLKKAQ